MHLGGAGGAADAVPAGAPAEKDDDVARIGIFTDHVFSGSSSHHRTDLHPLGHIARMIDLLYISGGQTDLVAIGGISLGSAVDDLTLGKFTLKRFAQRSGGVCSSCDAHGLVHIGAA